MHYPFLRYVMTDILDALKPPAANKETTAPLGTGKKRAAAADDDDSDLSVS